MEFCYSSELIRSKRNSILYGRLLKGFYGQLTNVLEISCQPALLSPPLAVGMIILIYQAFVALLSLPLMIQVFLALSLSFHHQHCIEHQKPFATIFVIIIPNKT